MAELYNQLEIHYYLHHNSHEIDAFFRNDCERELLNLFQEVINDLDLRVRIEATPAKEGGYIEIWKFVNANKELISLVVNVLTLLLSRYPVKNRRLDKAQIENLELDNLLKKEELKKLGITGFEKIDESLLKKIIEFLLKNYKIIWRRSNFFKKLTVNKEIKKIGINKLYNFKVSDEEIDLRLGDYEQFILFNEEIPDVKDNEVTIDLISSVLKKGNFRWRGFLEGQIINFVMEDESFKRLVFDGLLTHNNNVKLKVILNHSRKIDDSGLIRVTKYYVSKVVSYFVGGKEYKM